MASDSFAYSGSLSSNWTTQSGSFVVSNGACAINGGGVDIAFYDSTFSSDQSSSIVYSAISQDDGIGPAVRVTASGQGYISFTKPSGGYVQLYEAASGTELIQYSYTPIVGHVYTLAVEGVLITYSDTTAGQQIFSVTSNLITGGNPGLSGYGDNQATTISSWTGVSLGGAAIATALLFL